ncbi:unnamed protein product [Fusarium equiseti]|uniref:BTB domain-containing protein n=1 Tax=Fusarium equiseti TaxID=61235 RepID=A0A8J2N6P5_FUSEQ|nr:unnamed protein product [Fusarium equiseti]
MAETPTKNEKADQTSGALSFEDFAAKGDVVFIVKGETRVRVRSAVMMEASSVFNAMLGPNFKEGRALAEASSAPVEIPLPEDDPELFGWICRALHCQASTKLWKPVALQLVPLWMLIDKYNMKDSMRLSLESWISEHVNEEETFDIILWILAQMSLGVRNAGSFAIATRKLIQHSTESFVDDATCFERCRPIIPGRLLYKLAATLQEAREAAMARLVKLLYNDLPEAFQGCDSGTALYYQRLKDAFQELSVPLDFPDTTASLKTVSSVIPSITLGFGIGLCPCAKGACPVDVEGMMAKASSLRELKEFEVDGLCLYLPELFIMRTRKSNRTKRYTLEKYDFEGSSDEETLRRATQKTERDENFDETAAAEESAEEEELALDQEGGHDENEEVESEGPVSEPDGVPDRFARQRVRPIRPFNVRAAGLTGYLDLEPVADGRIVRSYWGPYDRGFKGKQLVEAWYGRHEDGVGLVKGMLDRWMDWTVLPPKILADEGQTDRAVWSPSFFEREAYSAEHWYERVQESLPGVNARIRLSPEEAELYRFQREPMPVLLGPSTSQQEIRFMPGDAYAISQDGLPLQNDSAPVGWMLDAGGIVTGMDWAPLHSVNAPQLLAICVIPHSDQELYDYEEECLRPDFQKYGVVQLWEFVGERQDDGFARPSLQPPTLRKTICLEQGRARRVRWSPACGFLAILCDDGNVYVTEAGDDGEGGYEKVVEPIAVFGFPDEDAKATTFTWINFNRLVIGYTDGSIALWSVRPHRLLSRHPVHHNIVVDLVSGYPAMPYLIASTPVGGTVKLLDLRAPSYESTEVQNLTVGTQPNLLGYSDHLLGFFSMYPSAGVLNTHVGFMHHSQFPVARRVFTGESYPSCLAVGRTHPYLLVGSLDGSLWAINPQVELFTTRREPTDRIRVCHHEHRPGKLFPADSPAAARGISRIVTGFILERSLTKHSAHKPPVKKGKKPKKKETDTAVGDDEEEGGAIMDPTRAIIYEPLTRVTVAEWNPNEEYGCWAAAAMGSGLVRVMDLGLTQTE